MLLFKILLIIFIGSSNHQFIIVNSSANRVIKYDEIVYLKQKKSSSLQQQTPILLDSNTNNLNDLQKTIQNILMIEHYSRDNLQQFKMIYECNEKLKSLENEFNSIYLDEWQKQSSFSNKTLRNLYQPQISTTRTTRTLNTINSDSQNMLENVRKHLVDYLK